MYIQWKFPFRNDSFLYKFEHVCVLSGWMASAKRDYTLWQLSKRFSIPYHSSIPFSDKREQQISITVTSFILLKQIWPFRIHCLRGVIDEVNIDWSVEQRTLTEEKRKTFELAWAYTLKRYNHNMTMEKLEVLPFRAMLPLFGVGLLTLMITFCFCCYLWR